MSTFTKGNWYNNGQSNFVFSAQGKTIAHVSLLSFPKEEYRANARLIASAPEMYELLLRYVDLLYERGTEPEIYAETLDLLARIDGEEQED